MRFVVVNHVGCFDHARGAQTRKGGARSFATLSRIIEVVPFMVQHEEERTKANAPAKRP